MIGNFNTQPKRKGLYRSLRDFTIVGLASLMIGACAKKDIKEEFIGFNELNNGYSVEEFYIPSKGDVTLVKKLEGYDYEKTELPDGSIKYEGAFYYKIKPKGKFAPNAPRKTDMYGRTPLNEEDDYWGDTRPGYVVFSKEDSLENSTDK